MRGPTIGENAHRQKFNLSRNLLVRETPIRIKAQTRGNEQHFSAVVLRLAAPRGGGVRVKEVFQSPCLAGNFTFLRIHVDFTRMDHPMQTVQSMIVQGNNMGCSEEEIAVAAADVLWIFVAKLTTCTKTKQQMVHPSSIFEVVLTTLSLQNWIMPYLKVISESEADTLPSSIR